MNECDFQTSSPRKIQIRLSDAIVFCNQTFGRVVLANKSLMFTVPFPYWYSGVNVTNTTTLNEWMKVQSFKVRSKTDWEPAYPSNTSCKQIQLLSTVKSLVNPFSTVSRHFGPRTFWTQDISALVPKCPWEWDISALVPYCPDNRCQECVRMQYRQ